MTTPIKPSVSPSPQTSAQPGSTVTVTTPKPTTTPQTETQKYRLTFDGDCEPIVSDINQKEEFMKQLKNKIAETLSIAKEQINIKNVECGSILVTLTITKATKDVTDKLKQAVQDNALEVVVVGKHYVASKIEINPTSPTSSSSTSSDKTLAFWLYVCFGAAMGLIFLIGLIIILVRCHRDRVTRTFTLNPSADLELKRYQGIPRASYYRVEMYGDPIEVDAANTGIDEEYDGNVVPYAQSDVTFRGGKQDSAHGNNNANIQGDFAMGNLPQWDVPKLNSSDVVVHEDSLHAYDNPVMTFGESTTELNKED